MNQILLLVTVVLLNSALCILFFAYQKKIFLSVTHWIILVLGAFILSTVGLYVSSIIINRFRIHLFYLKLFLDFSISFLTMLGFSIVFVKANKSSEWHLIKLLNPSIELPIIYILSTKELCPYCFSKMNIQNKCLEYI